MAENGKCLFCGNPIPQKEDGQGSYMVADLDLHHPLFPALQTKYANRWICHSCCTTIAANIAKNDSEI